MSKYVVSRHAILTATAATAAVAAAATNAI